MTTHRDAPIRTPLFVKGWQAIAYSRLWTTILLAIGVASSFMSAHAPLAAFATVSGITLPRSRAIAVVMAIWFINQLLGFTLRDYPLETTAIAWGAVMGIGALLAVNLASRRPILLLQSWTGYWRWGALAFIGSVVLYQGTILLALPLLGAGHGLDWIMLGKLVLKQATWAIAPLIAHALWLKAALYQSPLR